MATDFGKILEAWENSHGGTAVIEKPEVLEVSETMHRPSNKRLPVEDSVDLHGMTQADAEIAVNEFLRSAHERGLRKVLIIHGKGSHSDSDGTLRREIRHFLEKHPFTGELGVPKRTEGGSGAIWAIIRQRSR
ncbi:MAG: Smr/MutS family protein [Spirochaeta sp.]